MVLVPNFQETEFKLNKGDVRHAPVKLGSQVVRRSKRIFKGVFDFAVQGGAIGTLKLYDPVHGPSQPLVLPPSFIVSRAMVDVLVAPTSLGGATVALTSGQGAGDLLAATAIASVTGILDGVPDGTAAHAIKVPAAASSGSTVSAVVAVAALTAGKFLVHIEGYQSDAL